MDVQLVLVLLPLVAVLAVFVGYMSHKLSVMRSLGDAETRAKRIVGDAQRVGEQARVGAADLEAKEMALKMRGELEQETRTRQKEIQDVERRVLQQEEQLARRLDQLDRRESELQTRDRALGERDKVVSTSEARLSSALEEQRRKLEGIAGLTAEEAKRQLMAQVEGEARRDAHLPGLTVGREAEAA